MARAVLAAWCVPAAFPGSPALSDAQILGIYIQVNGFDIEYALLGRAQAESESVRKVASRVASDHAGVRQTAYALAAQCKIAVELPADRDAVAIEHGKALTKLMSLSGESFDKAYAREEVAFHRSAIEAVRSALLPAATCPALKTHLQSVLPAFEHHLTMTEAMERDLGAH